MIVMVEGRRPRCWGCKQIGHIAKFFPQRPENKEKASATSTAITKDTAAATTITINKEAEAQGPGQVQPKSNLEGWTEVTRKRKGSPKQGGKSTSLSPPQKKAAAVAAVAAAETPEPPVTPASATPATPAPVTSAPAASPRPSTPKTPTVPLTSPKKHKKKNKINAPEEMETNVNLKRRRDSGEGTAKKYAPNNPRQVLPLKNSKLLHLYLHHPFPLKSYNPHNPLIKLSPSHPNKNSASKNITDPIKSHSQGHNQLTGPSP